MLVYFWIHAILYLWTWAFANTANSPPFPLWNVWAKPYLLYWILYSVLWVNPRVSKKPSKPLKVLKSTATDRKLQFQDRAQPLENPCKSRLFFLVAPIIHLIPKPWCKRLYIFESWIFSEIVHLFTLVDLCRLFTLNLRCFSSAVVKLYTDAFETLLLLNWQASCFLVFYLTS